MSSPTKSYSYFSQQQPENIAAFKQQSMMLLRQQSQKIRELKAFVSSKDQELMIKEQQIKFLKQSIRDLESESQVLIQEKNEFKLKLEKIVQEVKNYNQHVVRPICQEKQQLKKANQYLKTINQELEKQLSQTNSQVLSSQNKSKSLAKQFDGTKSLLKQHQIKCFQLEKKLQKQSLNSARQVEQLLKINSLLNLQESRRSKLEAEVSALNKQLSSVINKHNSSIKDYEMRIKDIQNNMVNASEVLVYQELVKTNEGETNRLKSQLSLSNRNQEQIKFKYLSEKQKWAKETAQLKINIAQVNTDLTNLRKSIQVQKKVVEFQSGQSELFYKVYQKYQRLFQQRSELQQKHDQLLANNQRLSRDVSKLSQRLKDCEIQQTLMKTQLHQELQRLESTYEGKLVTLNLKIRKQEQAFQRLKKRQLQAMQSNQKLLQQFQATQQNFLSYQQTTSKSINKLNEQNYRIVSEIQQLHKICQDHVDNKRIVDKIKHIVHALLTALYYFQLKIIRNKQKQNKIYLPLIDSYLSISARLQEVDSRFKEQFPQGNSQPENIFLMPKVSKIKSPQNVTKIRNTNLVRKFRSGVWTVIATFRIRKSLQRIGDIEKNKNLSGIQLKLLKALNTRNKIQNISELMEKQAECYNKGEQTEHILCFLLETTEKAFTWPEYNFKSLNLDPQKHLTTLHSFQNQTLKS